MKFSYNWLKELAKFKESPQKLAEFLTLHSFEVESVEKAGNDWVLDVALLPNRVADAGGHRGLAREISAVLGRNFPNLQLITDNLQLKNKYEHILDIKIENKEDCRRYVGIVMEGVQVKESPAWMRERLEICGMQAINNLVDAANYIMLETGQPLHVFDMETLNAKRPPARLSAHQQAGDARAGQTPNKSKKIIVRRAKKGETMLALDNQKLELSQEILVIADAERPIAVAGIKGGKDSGISEITKIIIIEAANFSPSVVRVGSKALGLKTDASFRFEHDLDPNLAEHAAARLAELIREVAGGEIQDITDVYPVQTLPQKILLNTEYIHHLIGEEIAPHLMEGYLERLGFSVEKKNHEWLVEVSTLRRDIATPEDVIEEIARLYGYNKIKARAPKTLLHPALANDEHAWEEKTRDFFKGAGFTEAYSYAFTGEKEIRDFGDTAAGSVALENPTSPETQYLVKHSLFKYARMLEQNMRRENEVRIFAVAKDFALQGNVVEERKQLIAAFAKKSAAGLPVRGTQAGTEEFFEMKGVCDNLLRSFGVTDFFYDDATNAKRPPASARAGQTPNAKFYHPYRFAEVKIGDEAIGEIGELHPAIAEKTKLKARGIFLRIDFEKLWRVAESEHEFRQIPKFPAVTRDIALLIPRNTKIEAAQNVIEQAGLPARGLSAETQAGAQAGGVLLIDVDLFDYFEDFDKKTGKTSVAFHLVFQSPERTLTDTEVDAVVETIVKAAKEKGWIVR